MDQSSDIVLDDQGGVAILGSLRVTANSEIVSAGAGAGYAFTDRFITNQHWTWYAGDGKAFLTDNDGVSRLTVQPDGNVGIGTAGPKCPLHVEGPGEVHSGGTAGGFSFADRDKQVFVEAPSNGERWVWYAEKGQARLWSGQDRLQVLDDGTLIIQGDSRTVGRISFPGSADGLPISLLDANSYITSIQAVHTPLSPSGVTIEPKTKDTQVDVIRVLSHLLVYCLKLQGDIDNLNAVVIELQSDVKQLKDGPAKLPVPAKT